MLLRTLFAHLPHVRGTVLFVDRDPCKECHRRQRRDAGRTECPRCGKRRLLRPQTGWCGSCSRPGRPPNPDAACADCGQVTRLVGAGRCRACCDRSSHRIPVRAANLAATLENPADWLSDFAAYLVGRHHPSRACGILSRLGKHLAEGSGPHPQALLGAVAADVPLARALEDFFTANNMGCRATARSAAPLPDARRGSTPCPSHCARPSQSSPSTC